MEQKAHHSEANGGAWKGRAAFLTIRCVMLRLVCNKRVYIKYKRYKIIRISEKSKNSEEQFQKHNYLALSRTIACNNINDEGDK